MEDRDTLTETNTSLLAYLGDFVNSGASYQFDIHEMADAHERKEFTATISVRLPVRPAELPAAFSELEAALLREAAALGLVCDCPAGEPHGSGRPLRNVSPNERHRRRNPEGI